MQIFAYEFVSGGGWYSASVGTAPPASLAAEGWAMLEALLADLSAMPETQVSTLLDSRLPCSTSTDCTAVRVAGAEQERRAFFELAAQAEWTIVVAPEFEGFLATRSAWVAEAGGRLLGAPAALVELATDKHRTAELLGRNGIPVPLGRRIAPGAELPADFPYPAVIKPLDGAGSLGIRLLHKASDDAGPCAVPQRLERWCPGLPASISLLCGPAERIILPACEQILSCDGALRYLGGRLPLAAGLDMRARRLVARVAACLPAPLGYLGIDLVLGSDPLGSEDYVIEINPRLTTSYIGLRALIQGNLAAELVAVAAGRQAEVALPGQAPPRQSLATLSTTGYRVQFAADGRLLEPTETDRARLFG
jgi:tyramine---L-glutamate ligase